MTTPVLRYAEFMEAVPAGIPAALDTIVTADIHFRDPFNETRGIAHYRRVLHDMREQIADLRIDVTHAALTPARRQTDTARGLLRWEMSGRLVKLRHRQWHVSGCAEIVLAEDGRVSAHYDHWDAAGQLYEHFPVIGSCLRALRRRLEVR